MRKRYIIWLGLAGVVLVYLLLRALFVHQKVAVTRVQRGDLVTVVYATGTVGADSTATLRSESGGIVTYIGVQEGKSVKRGQILLRTDDANKRLGVEQANADLESAKIDLQNKTQNLERTAALFKSSSITQKTLDDARRDADLAKITLQRRKIALEIAEEELSNTVVTAPFSGVIISATAKLGDYLLPNGVCFQMIAPSSILVEAQVDEQDFARVVKGQKCVVAFDAYGDQRFDGYVYRIVPKTDEATKTSKVFVKLEDIPSGLNVGMTATVNIVSSRLHNALLVPRSAVKEVSDSSVVFSVEDGKVHEIKVGVGASDGKFSEVLGVDLMPGTMIITQPGSELKNGMNVEVSE
jgi:RND family efflux transporter MFP subunit